MRVLTPVLTLLAGAMAQAAFAGGYECVCPKEDARITPPRCWHGRLCGPPPPSGPVLETVAIRRVPLARETSFHLRQEAGAPFPERERTCSGEQEKGLANLMSELRDGQMEDFAKRLDKVESELGRIVELLERQHKLIDGLYAPEE